MGSEQTLADAMEFISTQGVLRVTRDERTTEYTIDQIHGQVTAFMRGEQPENVITGGTKALPIRELAIKEAVIAAEAVGVIRDNLGWFERSEFQAMIDRAPEQPLSNWSWPEMGIRDQYPCCHATLLYDGRGRIIGWEESGRGDQNKLYGVVEASQLEGKGQLRKMVVVFPVGAEEIKGQCARCYPPDRNDRNHPYVGDHVIMAAIKSYNEYHAEIASVKINPFDRSKRGDWIDSRNK